VKVKLLIGILVALIVLNLATMGSFVYWRWKAPTPDWESRAPRPDRDSRVAPPDVPAPPAPEPPLRLSREERAQLRSLLSAFRSETVELRRRIHEDETRVFGLMQLDSIPRAEVDSLLDEISRARLEIGRLAVDKLIESKAYLSPHQQQRFFNSILQTRPGVRMGEGWHERRGRGIQRGGHGGGERL
jgi:uncharacterized membrane protein